LICAHSIALATSPPAGYRVGIVRAVEGDRVFLVELEQAIGLGEVLPPF